MRTAKEVAADRKKLRNRQDRPLNGDPKLAETLSSLRASHNLTQRQVADETGVSGPYISQLESGYFMPSVGVVALLAAFYDVTLDDLAGHLVEAAKNGDSL